ncbi:MAG TPA: arsenate reductase ArsC [Thermoanaerobaculia bacterium]|nr:arsenate reductase ArsC [Thermoanaerobaculia bacterium]
MKKKILFLCTGNSARSQMAEALARLDHSQAVEAFSAGSRPTGGVHPNAVTAMAELGCDIRDARSKPASEFEAESFDAVVTVCDSAAQDCPSWPHATRIEHWSIEDPSFEPDPTHRKESFGQTRDDLRRRIAELVESLLVPEPPESRTSGGGSERERGSGGDPR